MNLLYATIHYKKQFHEIKTKNIEPIKTSHMDINSKFLLSLKCVLRLPSFFFTNRRPVSLPFCVWNNMSQISEISFETMNRFRKIKFKT